MDVRELNQEQLSVLKWKVFYDLNEEWLDCNYNGLTQEERERMLEEVDTVIIADGISDETIYTLFSGIDFVEEDF